ncbi:MAG: succinylglutamate desuccinylase/aspartoacylase family protein [Parvibaculaceae bacterium]
MSDARVRMTIDLRSPGKATGVILVPVSTNESAYGVIPIPIVAINGGVGPCLLLVAAIHGDEFEGPLALRRLTRELAPSEIAGRIILLPYANLPALRAGARVSPLDGKNLNRIFPGDAQGGPSDMLAHFMAQVLLPEADVVIDLHSGGRSLLYTPLAATHLRGDPAIDRQALDALKAFGAPIGLIARDIDSHGLFDYTAESLGKLVISTELGGGAIYDPEAGRLGYEGVRRLLHHFGVLRNAPRITTPSRIMETPSLECFSMSKAAGLYEPHIRLGCEVHIGDVLGEVHSLDDHDAASTVTHAKTSGILICRRGQGLVASGDCTAIVARDFAE